MLWIFKPVNNNYWFDVREFEVVDWKYKHITFKNISDLKWVLHELPVFKPKICFENRTEFNKQFTT